MPKTYKERVVLNISGEVFETFEETLARFPQTLLGQKWNRDMYYCTQSRQHFFDCNRTCFGAILYFYQSNGSLKCPEGISVYIFEKECLYFQLPIDKINKMKRDEGILFELPSDNIPPDKLPFQLKLWNYLDNPQSSCAAWVFALFSFIMIALSIITSCLETMPLYHTDSRLLGDNRWIFIELVANIWFCTEFVLRLLTCPNKSEFLQGSMNWIDMMSVVPYFILLLLNKNISGLVGIFKTLKFMRVFRLFRLSKHSRRLEVIGIILKSSLKSFQLIMICLVVVVMFGASIIYAVESHQSETSFKSIPISAWWSIQTVTSLGYGDMVPTSIFGRGLAVCYMVFGAITFTLPVLTLVAGFLHLYPKNVEWGNDRKFHGNK